MWVPLNLIKKLFLNIEFYEINHLFHEWEKKHINMNI